MIEWKVRGRGKALSIQTEKGTALIYDLGTAATLDMWGPNQETIGHGRFDTVQQAQERAQTILDPRETAWDVLNDGFLQDDLNETVLKV